MNCHQPVLNMYEEQCANLSRVVYGGPITPALQSYSRRDTVAPAGALARDSFSDRQ